jgi:hypothetical protein
MDNMIEIGLKSLTHILKGGVRIEKNRNLCYVKTIYWDNIVHKDYHDNIHIEVSSSISVDVFTNLKNNNNNTAELIWFADFRYPI